MKKYKYKMMEKYDCPEDMIDDFNIMGKKGWELIFMTKEFEYHSQRRLFRYYFKFTIEDTKK